MTFLCGKYLTVRKHAPQMENVSMATVTATKITKEKHVVFIKSRASKERTLYIYINLQKLFCVTFQGIQMASSPMATK
jgi:hypothetical protein